jgi:membrane-associated phospholipid phosphatase
MELLENMFFYVGNYSQYILFLITLYFLWNKQKLLYFYIAGYVLNRILNNILKIILKQPRPSDDEKLFNVALRNSKQIIYKNRSFWDIYGMPSGHAESVFYSTVFIYLSLKSTYISIFYFIFSLLVCFQRVYFKFHTLAQVLVGSIVGGIFSYIVFYFAQKNIRGRLIPKKEDYGPL